MPLEDAQVIDVVRKTDDGKIVVVITDNGAIADPKERVACLVQKLKSYIHSIVSGDLKRDHPEHTAKDFIIEVACRRSPTPEMMSISQVMPRKDPANTVPVKFVESPKGAWGPTKPEIARERLVPAKTPEAKVVDSKGGESKEAHRLEPLAAAALDKGMELAEKYLKDGQQGFYFAVLGWDENKTEPVFFRENSVDPQTVREVEQYVRELTPAFTMCVLVSVGSLRIYRHDKRDAVILILHRRGWDKGKVYARPIRKKGVFHKYEYDGRMERVGSKPGLFPA